VISIPFNGLLISIVLLVALYLNSHHETSKVKQK